MAFDPKKVWYSTTELAELLDGKYKATTLRNMAQAGTGPKFHKPNGRRGKTLYHVAAICEWLGLKSIEELRPPTIA